MNCGVGWTSPTSEGLEMRIAGRFRGVRTTLTTLTVGGLGFLIAVTGCEHKEKVLDIKGPGIDVEVNKTTGGKREIEINSNKKQTIEIETTK
jgi:hypothetical protein